MIEKLVVNGCSYMETYASGNGHYDLADKLNIPIAESLAIGGSANSRILRTTLKHSYKANNPTLYVIGLTFIQRSELPICTVDDENTSFEGRWINPQNQEFSNRWEHFWSRQESEKFVEFKLRTEVYGVLDRVEDLMYQTLAAITCLKSRGHSVVVYQQADTAYDCHLGNPRLQYFNTCINVIEGFAWRAILYQHQQGVPPTISGPGNFIGPQTVPEEIKHRQPGQHQILNDFLVKYINDHRLL
jgi:hypothetical protein